VGKSENNNAHNSFSNTSVKITRSNRSHIDNRRRHHVSYLICLYTILLCADVPSPEGIGSACINMLLLAMTALQLAKLRTALMKVQQDGGT